MPIVALPVWPVNCLTQRGCVFMATQRRTAAPLIDIQSEAFAKQYELGVWWSMHGDEQGQGLVSDSYFVANFKRCVEHGYFDGLHEQCLHYFGFYLGMYHGGILSPATGELRADVHALVAITHQEFACGYNAGRRAYFTELDPQERIYTEAQFLQRLTTFVQEDRESIDTDDSLIYWIFGDLFGLLSGSIFPMTEHECRDWNADKHQLSDVQERHTEPLPAVTLQKAS